jgi:hypothetical protein
MIKIVILIIFIVLTFVYVEELKEDRESPISVSETKDMTMFNPFKTNLVRPYEINNR